jgi:hypothetical protein
MCFWAWWGGFVTGASIVYVVTTFIAPPPKMANRNGTEEVY